MIIKMSAIAINTSRGFHRACHSRLTTNEDKLHKDKPFVINNIY